MKERKNNYESKERTKKSYLMTKTTDELSVDPNWYNFVQECIDEHGYSWQHYARQKPFGKYIKMNYSKTRKKQ